MRCSYHASKHISCLSSHTTLSIFSFTLVDRPYTIKYWNLYLIHFTGVRYSLLKTFFTTQTFPNLIDFHLMLDSSQIHYVLLSMTPTKKKSTSVRIMLITLFSSRSRAPHSFHLCHCVRLFFLQLLCYFTKLVEDVLKTISKMILLGRFHLIRVVLALIFVILFVTIYTNWHDNSVIHLK